MLLKRPRYRRFEYAPRYYRPETDEKEHFKKELRRERGKHRGKRRPVILWGIILVLTLYAYLYLTGSLR
jgi:hypothetical protein